MSIQTNKLTQMIKDAPDQAAGISSSIASVEDRIADLAKQQSGVQDGVCGATNTDMQDYLTDVKLPAIAAAAGNPEADYRVAYGPDYGSINWDPLGNISDWAIEHKTIVPPVPPAILPTIVWVPVYVYEGVGWDNDSSIITWIEDYSFGNDYITKPLTEGATYGLKPNIDTLGLGKGILEENKSKVEDSVDVFSRYAT